MKKILISIRPQWTAKILNGEKTIEVRKTAPKCELPCEVYIYCTNGREVIKSVDGNYKKIKSYTIKKGCVCAKFTLNKVGNFNKKFFGTYEEPFTRNQKELLEKSCLTEKELDDYLKGKNGYAWHIDDLVIFDKPKGLEEFEFPNPSGIRYIGQRAIKGLPSKKRPPQSWCYCEVEE